MMKLIPLLTDDEGVPFDPVIPFIIGFGYSGESKVEGCNSAFVVDLWQKIMPTGFELYGAQDGDNLRNQKNQSSDKKCYRRTHILVTQYIIWIDNM